MEEEEEEEDDRGSWVAEPERQVHASCLCSALHPHITFCERNQAEYIQERRERKMQQRMKRGSKRKRRTEREKERERENQRQNNERMWRWNSCRICTLEKRRCWRHFMLLNDNDKSQWGEKSDETQLFQEKKRSSSDLMSMTDGWMSRRIFVGWRMDWFWINGFMVGQMNEQIQTDWEWREESRILHDAPNTHTHTRIHTHSSWIIYSHHFLSHTNLSPPLLLCGLSMHAVCMWYHLHVYVCVCRCVCVSVCVCEWVGDVRGHTLYEPVFVVFLSVLAATQKHTKHFKLQAAQLCRDASTPPQHSKHSSVTTSCRLPKKHNNGSELHTAAQDRPSVEGSHCVTWSAAFFYVHIYSACQYRTGTV